MKKKSSNGFTIVELLIVIVVIGILAAITIVAFNGVQNRANDATIRNDLVNFKKKLALAKIDSANETYPSSLTSAMGLAFSKDAYLTNRNNVYYCVSADFTQYALGVVSKVGTNNGYLLFSDGSIQTSAAVNDANTCALVSKLNGSHIGYSWNGTTGAWQSWTN